MEFRLRPLGFMKCFYKTIITRQLTKGKDIIYIYIYIYILLLLLLLLLYNTSIPDIEHSSFNIALGSPLTH